MDFFVWPIRHDLDEDRRLTNNESEYVYPEADVRRFLEEHCGLSVGGSIHGKQFTEHVDAFKIWQQWVTEGKLKEPFAVVHVDAHGDFGSGAFNSTPCLLAKVLAKPIGERRNLAFSPEVVTSANYLTFAIANRWISSLTYVYPTDPLQGTRQVSRTERFAISMGELEESGGLPPVRDVPAWLFQKKDRWWERPIQLHLDEPEIPFQIVKKNEFRCSSFTHMLVAQSPQYTPESADILLPIIEQYFRS